MVKVGEGKRLKWGPYFKEKDLRSLTSQALQKYSLLDSSSKLKVCSKRNFITFCKNLQAKA